MAKISRRLTGPLSNTFKRSVIRGDDYVDAVRQRIYRKLSLFPPRHIAAYRGFADENSVELMGRVLGKKPRGGPDEADRWWTNLANTYRRFASREVPGIELSIQLRDATTKVITDHEGYYQVRFDVQPSGSDLLWEQAVVSLGDGGLETRQPVLNIGKAASFGVISDVDDTVLESSITDWKTALSLLLLHNARTRKPLQGVAPLYQAFQMGAQGTAQNPIFYVSSSPWNLYDLIDDFLDLNAIPQGPLFLRDLGTDEGKFFKSPGHRHKLERACALIERFPHLRWVLVGDSGQADAELYAEAAHMYGSRILAIYIRDVDLQNDSRRDRYVDGFVEKVAGTGVPMLRVADSTGIAEHAASLGLIAPSALPIIAREAARDEKRATLTEAAAQELI